jgi:hypothetical protein
LEVVGLANSSFGKLAVFFESDPPLVFVSLLRPLYGLDLSLLLSFSNIDFLKAPILLAYPLAINLSFELVVFCFLPLEPAF